MKTAFLSLALLLSITAFGQKASSPIIELSQGTWSFGGSLNLNTLSTDLSSEEGSHSLSFYIEPEVGYALANNLFVELGLGYGYGYVKTDSEIVSNRYTLTITPSIEKYWSLSDNLFLSLEGGLQYQNIKNEYEFENNLNINNISSRQRANSYGVYFVPKISYFLTNKLSASVSYGELSYLRRETENRQNVKTTSDQIRFALNSENLLFGLTYFCN